MRLQNSSNVKFENNWRIIVAFEPFSVSPTGMPLARLHNLNLIENQEVESKQLNGIIVPFFVEEVCHSDSSAHEDLLRVC